jgi:hypothetical protein
VPDDGGPLEALRVGSEKAQANKQAIAERPAEDGTRDRATSCCALHASILAANAVPAYERFCVIRSRP